MVRPRPLFFSGAYHLRPDSVEAAQDRHLTFLSLSQCPACRPPPTGRLRSSRGAGIRGLRSAPLRSRTGAVLEVASGSIAVSASAKCSSGGRSRRFPFFGEVVSCCRRRSRRSRFRSGAFPGRDRPGSCTAALRPCCRSSAVERAGRLRFFERLSAEPAVASSSLRAAAEADRRHRHRLVGVRFEGEMRV